MNRAHQASEDHGDTIIEVGQHVVVTSRLIGRENVVVGVVTRTGTELRVGPLVLWDDRSGRNTLVRIVTTDRHDSATS